MSTATGSTPMRDGESAAPPGSATAREPTTATTNRDEASGGKQMPTNGKPDTGDKDEREIRALVDRTFDAWDRGDAPAYHADFTGDADYVSYDGSRRGKADSESSHLGLFRTVLYGSRLIGEIESVRFVTPDVAVAHILSSIVEGWRQRPYRRRLSRQTMVAVRRDGRWRITHFQNVRVRPISTSGHMVEFGGRFVRWRTDRARQAAKNGS